MNVPFENVIENTITTSLHSGILSICPHKSQNKNSYQPQVPTQTRLIK